MAENFDNEADFTRVYSNTFNGDIAATGSPVLCATSDNKTCNWNYSGYLFDITPLSLHDGDTSTFPKNSGGAILKLPADVNGSDILWAKLYWQGHIFGLQDNEDSFSNAIKNLNKVTMADPKGNMHTLTANKSEIYYYGYNNKDVLRKYRRGYRFFYQASVDVTKIVQNSYTLTNNYFIVGNINTTQTKDTYYIYDTKLGTNVKWGNWGGWSLVVAYKQPNAPLKNINLYQGFKFLLPPFGGTASLEIPLPPNSFYTPNFGIVKSKTVIFAAGAEKKIAADKLELYSQNNGYQTVSNTLNPADNQINDSITYLNTEINATRIFNPGTDLDTYDTSNILSNGQTTTKIKVTMTANTNSADQAFVGFIGISNDIYQPKICYLEKLYDDQGVEINSSSRVNVGDMVEARLTIRNDDNETATDVNIKRSFDDNITTYHPNSTTVNNIDTNGILIGDINQTDEYGDDLVDYNTSGQSLSVNIGRAANASTGGNFLPGDVGYINYRATINTNQDFNLSYETSYVFNIAGQQFSYSGTLPKCADFDNTLHAYLTPIGIFNVVNGYTTIGGSDPIDNNDSKNSLFTQVVNQSFPVKVFHLNSTDKTTPEPFEGVTFLEVVDATSISSDQSTCVNAPIVYTPPTNNITKDFNNQSFIDINVTIPKAIQNATFRIGYTDWGTRINNSGVVCANRSTMDSNLKGVPQCLNSEQKIQQVFYDKDISQCLTSGPYGQNAACNSNNYNASGSKGNIQPERYNNKYGCAQCLVGNYVCARDNFAVRPAAYTFALDAQNPFDANVSNPLKGGKDYTLNIDTGAQNYNQTITNTADRNASLDLIIPAGCNLAITHIPLTPNITFDGSTGKAVFAPLNFNNIGDVNLTLFDNDWTKIDQDTGSGKGFDECILGSSSNTPINGKVGCMISGSKKLIFLPKSFANTINVQNFNDSNFTYLSNDANMSANIIVQTTALLDNNATATNYTAGCYSQDINFTISLINNPTNWLNGLPDAKTRIRYFDDGNHTSFDNNNTVGSAEFNATQSEFLNGTASNLGVKFNFARSTTLPDEPFRIKKNDFNISVQDANNIIGNDFNRTTDQNVTFYYGRVHAPDYRFEGNSGNAKIYYEVYCKDCNKSLFGVNGNESVDSIDWYLNQMHLNNSFGDVSANGANSFFALSGTSAPGYSGTISNGIETITLSHAAPYKDKIQMYANPWLIFNTANSNAAYNDFLVEFYKSGSWAGQGIQGKTVDLNISVKQNKRLDW